MGNEKMIKILKRIELFIEQDSLDLAKDMTRLEIENLMRITEQRCKNTKYYFYDFYCKYCNNLNCHSNQNTELR